MSEPLLSVSHLKHAFADKIVLHDLNFHIDSGEIVGLLGANGSGKSTALFLLTGLLRAQHGQFALRGKPLAFGACAFRATATAVFQQPSIDPRLSGYENLALSARLFGVGLDEVQSNMKPLLDAFSLSDRLGDLVKHYSGGMRRKLDLVRALLSRPALVLLDEPTSGLDHASFEALWTFLIEEQQHRGQAVLLTTHRAEEAERCTRLLILHEGRVVREGSPETLIKGCAGDVIILSGPNLEVLENGLKEKLGLGALRVGSMLHCEVIEAHALVPKIVQSFTPGQISSITIRRPGLGDVFTKLTGASLQRQSEN